MQELLTPNPGVLALLVMKKFAFIEIVAILALIRIVVGRGWSRGLALIAFVVALVGIVAVFGPAWMGVWSGPFYDSAQGVVTSAGGWAVIWISSGALVASALVPGRRWWGIDVIHGLTILAFVILWAIYS